MDTPFFGGFYVGRSREVADNRCINLYAELVDTKDGKAVGALYSCPGLDLLASIGPGPQRGSYFASNGTLYVVSGNELFSVDDTWTGTLLGRVGTSTGPVYMVDNGNQLLLVDGTAAWCLVFSTKAFTNVLPAGVSAVPTVLAYQDGFGLVNFSGTNQWYQSDLNDFTTWSALNFSSADSTPFDIVAMYDLHREVWLFKSDRIEVWINAGLPDFAFQRLQGVQIPQGCVAPASLSRIGDSIIWLGGDEQGQGIVYMSAGYQAARISTHAIEYAISRYSTIADAVGYTYQDTGHTFYVLTFPTGNQTFVFDYSTKLWHERAAFSNGQFSRHVGNSHAFAYQKQVIGDFQTGNLYAFDNNTYTDNGNVRKWLRSWRAFPPGKRLYVPFRFDSIFVDCMTGFNIPPGTDPQYMLRWSDDGGYTWSNEWWTDGNKTGATSSRIIFQRLGSTKRAAGLDRIFELSGTDPVMQAILAVDLDGEPT